MSLEALEATPVDAAAEEQADAGMRRARLSALVERLAPLDRQLVLLYLEGLEAAEIGEVTGLSAANVATKIHRIKKVLAARVRAGAADA